MTKRFCVIFSLTILATAVYHLATWPIGASDTDLWYHLNGGRYFYQTGSVARISFFSFIQPVKEWIDYYWLFQVIVYRVFQPWGYTGLIYF